MKKTLLLVVLPLLLALGACTPGGGAGNPEQNGFAAKAGTASESGVEDLQGILAGYVGYLASDALGGREVGTPGIAEAERYVAETLRSFGLSPLPGQDDLFLEFTLHRGGYDPEATALSVSVGGTTLHARPGVDFRPFNFSATGSFHGELIFAGYGITAPEYQYDDYAGLEAKGRIVLVLRHEPRSPVGSEYFQGADLTRHSLFLTKVQNARAHGAAGMLLVTDPGSGRGAEDFRLQGPLGLRPADAERSLGERQPIPALHISQPFARKILSSFSLDLEGLQQVLDQGSAPPGLGLPRMSVNLSVSLKQTSEELQARNVAAFLEGSDPLLKEEWILIGAHHDHLGSFPGQGDTIFNGADDNASGTAGVLAAARILAGTAPARSIVFATFSAEEEGLLGSKRMVEAQIPAERVVLMINLDMIGRNPDRPVQVMGAQFSPDLRRLVEEANLEVELPFRFSSGPEAAVSDHHSFYRQGVPFLFFFTGIHEDYHGTGDHAGLLSYPRMAEVVRLAAGTATLAAEAAPAPGSSVYVDWLGLTVADSGGRTSMAEVSAVEQGAPADRAGLHRGDRLVALGGRIPAGRQELRRLFDSVRPGGSLSLKVLRGGREMEMEVQRAHAGYLGVMIGDVDEQQRQRNELEARPGALIREVVQDGPAARAGLREGDVLVAVGETAVGPANLHALLAQLGAGTRVEVTVLRQGERLELSLTLGRRP